MPETNTDTAENPSSPRRETRTRRRNDTAEERSDTAEDRQPARQEPDRNAIEVRAYELYLERGGSEGDPVDDWLRAERELWAR